MLLPIRIAPDPMLRTQCAPVGLIDAEVKQLLEDMLATMYDAPGIGLAAPQVGVARRLVVIDVADPEQGDKPAPLRLIDPEIVWSSEAQSSYDEGCLSLPQQYALITRPAEVEVAYTDIHGAAQRLRTGGLLATCLQHEIDHLNGVLFVDRLSPMRRSMIMKKLAKVQKGK